MQKTHPGQKISQMGVLLALLQANKCKKKNNRDAKANWRVFYYYFFILKNPLQNYSGKSEFAVCERGMVAFHALPDKECYDFKELSNKRE